MEFNEDELKVIMDLIYDWGFEYSLKADREKVRALAERLGLNEWSKLNEV